MFQEEVTVIKIVLKDKELQALVLKEGKVNEGRKMNDRSQGTTPSGRL